MNRTYLLAICGSTGSGKTTTARLLASAIGWRHFSFGAYVTELARRKGMASESRRVLQNVGQEAVEKDVRGFVQGFLQANSFVRGEHAVLDGVRHIQVLEEIRRQTGASWMGLLFLFARPEVRKVRLRSREGESSLQVEDHPVETQVESLRGMADLEIDTSYLSQEQVAQKIQTWLDVVGVTA